MRLALILAFCACPVAAEDVVRDGAAWVSLSAADGPHVAAVTFQNRLTRCVGWCESVVGMTLTDGITVRVALDYGGGDAPDTMTVFPPDGYIAIPDSVTVAEDEQGVILIYAAGLS